jgi:hypothetical protein
LKFGKTGLRFNQDIQLAGRWWVILAASRVNNLVGGINMILFKQTALLVTFTLATLLATQAIAKPPTIPGNSGVPGLLAEIEVLEEELATTREDLAETEAELTTTQGELVATQSSLTSTLAELQITEGELGISNALLDESLEELEREQNRYRVPQTGQGDCWGAPSENPDDPHDVIPCDFTGQDGDHQAGLAPPLGRFVDNGNGTVTDIFTNLVWLIRGDCADDFSWRDAKALANNLNGMSGMNLCSLRDGSASGLWRLPNIREMMSLLDYESLPALADGHPFINLAGTYWTSTTFALDPLRSLDFPYNVCNGPRNRYGTENWDRFNEAYVVNTHTGEVRHAPKERVADIARRYKKGDGGTIILESCFKSGFTDGTPRVDLPQPKFIAVRSLTVGEVTK